MFRDFGTGGLAFTYTLEQTHLSGILDLEDASIGSSGGFDTDVYSSVQDHRVTRSADGTTLDYVFDFEGADGTFLVRTDARAFSAAGTFSFGGEFEPGRGTDGAVFMAYAPVPEPSALALAATAAVFLVRCRGRARRTGTGGLT